MANSSITQSRYQARHVRAVKLVCLSDDATGAVSGDTTLMNGCFLERVVVVPGTSTLIPDDNYDLTITTPTAQGAKDVLGAAGANLGQAANVDMQPKVGSTPAVVARYPIFGNLTVNLTNMGNANQVTIWLLGSIFS